MQEYKENFERKLMLIFLRGNCFWNDYEEDFCSMEIESGSYENSNNNSIVYEFFEDENNNNMIID